MSIPAGGMLAVHPARTHWASASEFVDDSLDDHSLCVFETLEGPAIEPEAEYAVVVCEGALEHLEDARLARSPIAVDADGHRCVRRLADQIDDRLRDRLIVEEISCGLLIVQKHDPPSAHIARAGNLSLSALRTGPIISPAARVVCVHAPGRRLRPPRGCRKPPF